MMVTVLMTPLTHCAVARVIDCGTRAVESNTPAEPENSVLSRLPRWISDIAESAPVCAASCDVIEVPPEPLDGLLGSGPPVPPPAQPARAMAAATAIRMRIRMVGKPFLGKSREI